MTLAWRADGPAGAPTLVLLNSVGTSSEMWTPCIAPLAEQFRVVRIDTRGHGDSPPAAPGAPCDLADLGCDVLAVLDELGVGRVQLAGLSLGGMVGMWLAIHHPERVGRLGLLCTSAYLPPAQFWLDRAAAVRAGGMVAIADTAVDRWITPELAQRDPELRTFLRDMLAGVDAESYAQCAEAIATMDLRPDLGRIAAPTLIIAGLQDPATPPEHAEQIARGITGSRLEVLDPASHIATFERPGAIGALLLDHFRGGATLAGGYTTRRAVLGDAHVERAIAATTEFSAPFQELLTRYAWGDVWSRPELSRRERSVATLAALVTLGAEHELAMHVRAAQRNGLTAAEIREVLMHTALYAGLPRGNRAFAIAGEVLDALDQPSSEG
jgi:3-oxoadipate enol-lactonase / 4-carboxymuconolactone decarboxylase